VGGRKTRARNTTVKLGAGPSPSWGGDFMRESNADYWQLSACQCHEYECARDGFLEQCRCRRTIQYNTIRAQHWRADDRCDKWGSVMNLDVASARRKAGDWGGSLLEEMRALRNLSVTTGASATTVRCLSKNRMLRR